MNNRRWTPAEDALVSGAVAANREGGLLLPGGRFHAGRLAHVARQIGRSYGAVRKRAQRLGERSYRSRDDSARSAVVSQRAPSDAC